MDYKATVKAANATMPSVQVRAPFAMPTAEVSWGDGVLLGDPVWLLLVLLVPLLASGVVVTSPDRKTTAIPGPGTGTVHPFAQEMVLSDHCVCAELALPSFAPAYVRLPQVMFVVSVAVGALR